MLRHRLRSHSNRVPAERSRGLIFCLLSSVGLVVRSQQTIKPQSHWVKIVLFARLLLQSLKVSEKLENLRVASHGENQLIRMKNSLPLCRLTSVARVKIVQFNHLLTPVKDL